MTACRICGCTDARACGGGCWWVVDPADLGPLCSTCTPIAELQILEQLALHPDVLEVLATT